MPSHEQRPHVELNTVYEISRGLCASLDIKHSFHMALTVLAAHLDLPKLMLVLPDDANQCLALHSSVGLSVEQAQQGLWRVDEGVVGQVFTSGMSMVIPDVSQAPEFQDRTGAFSATGGRPVSFVAVPLRAEQAVLGVLAARRTLQGDERLADDQRLLTMVASLLAQALLLHQAVYTEHQRLQQETTSLRKALYREQAGTYTLGQVIGDSKPMQRVFAEVHKAAPSKATVLLRGESGTGKEAIARAVHGLSTHKDGPFVAINCAAVAETLLESELFGHERGAFTGAIGERKGRFEQAHRGSLFLDEIGDISAAFQAKLLRVLQEREFERVGGNRPVKVDVRLICATNRDLEAMVERGEYRADLYYRINVIPIFLPPLRERRADIPRLIDHFLARYNEENQRQLNMTPEAQQILLSCQWPGNVRELQNCIERAATMARDDTIRAPDVACMQNRCMTKTLNHFEVGEPAEPEPALPAGPADAPRESAHEVPSLNEQTAPQDERERLIWVMEQCGWVQAKAARALKVSTRQLSYALQKHRIEVRKL
jgi:Nif-specific regulatory protein